MQIVKPTQNIRNRVGRVLLSLVLQCPESLPKLLNSKTLIFQATLIQECFRFRFAMVTLPIWPYFRVGVIAGWFDS